jgi:hypothetical protein
MKYVKALAQSLMHIMNPSFSVSILLFFYGHAFGTDNTECLNLYIIYAETISDGDDNNTFLEITIEPQSTTLYKEG